MSKRVVVTGMGMISAHGVGIESNWYNVASGSSGIREIKSFDASCYRGCIGGEANEFIDTEVDKLRKNRLDRSTLLLVHTVREALINAAAEGFIHDIDVFMPLGTTLGGMLSGQLFHKEVITKGLDRARVSLVSDYLAHYQPVNLFKEFGLKGDATLFSDACASGSNAVGYAYRSIRNGRYHISICGGYDTMSEFTFAGFNSLMAVSPTMCRPFDRNRDGLVLGEGAGILVLEELEFARSRNADILAEVAGFGESSDAYHMTSPDPSGRQAARAMLNALDEAGLPDIDYINAHGTGTKFNDAMEANAIALSFHEKSKTIPVSSIKPMIGHTLGGAGAVEAIISILALRNNLIPANLNYNEFDPECDLNIIKKPERSDLKTVMSNSFGFGGSNASLIFKEYS